MDNLEKGNRQGKYTFCELVIPKGEVCRFGDDHTITYYHTSSYLVSHRPLLTSKEFKC